MIPSLNTAYKVCASCDRTLPAGDFRITPGYSGGKLRAKNCRLCERSGAHGPMGKPRARYKSQL